MFCIRCGTEMRRLVRESFLQRKVYPLFGYYPWECPLCREPVLFKQRGVRKKRSARGDAHQPESGFSKPSSQAPAGITATKTR
jgi:DNA-directed RNA polymerase subunit RPC12/RpoP